jgi:hypothetical protein
MSSVRVVTRPSLMARVPQSAISKFGHKRMMVIRRSYTLIFATIMNNMPVKRRVRMARFVL